MHDQPKYIPYRPVDQLGSITDGRSARPVVEGTVARGQLYEDVEFYTGKVEGFAGQRGTGAGQTGSSTVGPSGATATQTAGVVPGQTSPQPAARPATDAFAGFINTIPMTISAEDLDRGEQKFNVFCAVCHGKTGDGDGMIVRRGFRRPPTYHEDRLRNAPPGYIFDVVTNGFGTMPDYSSQIDAADRWRIIAFIRALQLSRNATAADVPADKREQLNAKPAAKPGSGHEERR